MPSTKAHDFSGYRQFTANLRRMADEPSWNAERSREVTASLDGVAGKELHTQRVNDFLDQRICCQHLTVGAVNRIPLQGGRA